MGRPQYRISADYRRVATHEWFDGKLPNNVFIGPPTWQGEIAIQRSARGPLESVIKIITGPYPIADRLDLESANVAETIPSYRATPSNPSTRPCSALRV
jgi:hypothetical protein